MFDRWQRLQARVQTNKARRGVRSIGTLMIGIGIRVKFGDFGGITTTRIPKE